MYDTHDVTTDHSRPELAERMKACALPSHQRLARLAGRATQDLNCRQAPQFCTGCESTMLFNLNAEFRVEVRAWEGMVRWQVFETWGEPVLAHDLPSGAVDQRWPLTGVYGEITAESDNELDMWLEQFVGPRRAPHDLDRALNSLRPWPAETDALGQIERHTAVTLADEDIEVGQARLVLDDYLIVAWQDRLRCVDADHLELPQVPILVGPKTSEDTQPAIAGRAQLYWTAQDGLTYCEDLRTFLWHPTSWFGQGPA